ncbi:hypothetical protein HDV05_006200 [Chytridiales sp. JEL 0842]|nr:hypothetical protein HDV05_006200 [Chytridiales sp. JEL 0842]
MTVLTHTTTVPFPQPPGSTSPPLNLTFHYILLQDSLFIYIGAILASTPTSAEPKGRLAELSVGMQDQYNATQPLSIPLINPTPDPSSERIAKRLVRKLGLKQVFVGLDFPAGLVGVDVEGWAEREVGRGWEGLKGKLGV